MAAKKISLILWVDLRYTKTKISVSAVLEDIYEIYVITGDNDIEEAIDQYKPDIICFDYDLPDQVSLGILKDAKRLNPSLPFIMLTEDHSTELAIWALRLRAWDYYVKPVVTEEILASIEVLLEKKEVDSSKRPRDNIKPQPDIPTSARPYRTKLNGASTGPATNFIQQNLGKKITVVKMSELCGMSKSHFSRTFKKNLGITFQDYLTQERMNRAVELLKNSDLLVTQVALAVGYCELSNFTTIFQRQVGISPSGFRRALMPQRVANKDD